MSAETKTVYISHPIKGRTEAEIALLENEGRAWVAERSMTPLLPRDIEPWEHDGDCPASASGNGGLADEAAHSHGCYLRGDLVAMLTKADAILMMPGWELSHEARAEMQTALTVSMPVHFYPSAAS